MELSIASASSQGFTTLGSCRGKIFQLYIVQNKTSKEVRDILKEDHCLDISPKVFKTKTAQWGYTKNVKRSDVLEIMREKAWVEGIGERFIRTFRERPIDPEKISRHSRRAFARHLRPEFPSNVAPIVGQDVLAGSLPQSLPVFQTWRLPEKFFHNLEALVKGSFESGRWSFNGNELIINSSPSQVFEVQSLHDFLGDITSGCDAADSQNFAVAGDCWKRAFINLEILIEGQYHDIIPNLIQTINDLNRQGRSDLANSLKRHATNCCKKFLAPGSSNFSVYNDLADLDMASMINIEEIIMRRFAELFELYLGPLCYNSFAMMIDGARRRLVQNPWTTFEDCLPAIACLDAAFGPSDRRCLDVIGMRIEISHKRGLPEESEKEALQLIQRAEMVQNDDWQRFYHLTRGWYFLGCARYTLNKRDAAKESFENALQFEQDLCKVDDYHIFTAERIIMLKYLEDMSNAGEVEQEREN